MNIKRKSPEQLQAQVESYADSLVGSDGYSQRYRETQDIFFRYAGLLANMQEGDELPENAPQELVDAVRDHSRLYVRFLRTASREDRDFRTANNRLYQETFSPLVETLKASLPMREGKIDRDALSQHPQYVGSGTNGHAFRLGYEGRTYVIKFLHYASQANFEHKPLVRARGIPHVVQLVCFSIPDNVVITKLLPGKGMDAVSEEELPTIPDEHIVELIKTVSDLDARGIWKERRAKIREDKRIGIPPLVHLDSFPDDAELNILREELLRMGYGSV